MLTPQKELTRQLIDQVVTTYCQLYEQNGQAFRRLQEIIQRHHQQPRYMYQLLYGLVQSGKSPLIHLLLWYLQMRYGYRCALITLKLDCVRADIIAKLNDPHNRLNRVIHQVCPQQASQLIIKLTTFRHKEAFRPQHVAVYLMQQDNYRQLVKFIKQIKEQERPLCVIVDEVHEMYTSTKDMIDYQTLPNPHKLHNRTMIHYLLEEARQARLLVMGVTATPISALADPVHASPHSVLCLPLQQPAPQLVYYGLSIPDSSQCRAIEVRPYDQIRDTLQEIINQDMPLIEGKREIRCVLITTESYNHQQQSLAQQIQTWFPDRAIVALLNQQKLDDGLHVANIAQLFHLWQTHITERVARQGLLCVVAKKCVRAGITFKGQCHFKNYSVNGLTHMIIKPSSGSNIESQLQFMRLQGWYPAGHRSILYCPRDYLEDYVSDMTYAIRQAVHKYDGTLHSIAQLYNPCRFYLSANKYYRRCNRSNLSWTLQDTPPQQGHQLHTTIYYLNGYDLRQAGLDPEASLQDLYKDPGRQRLLRTLCYQVLAQAQVEHGQPVQIPYGQERYDSLIKYVLRPGRHTNYQINSLVTGPQQWNSSLRHLRIVHFHTTFQQRQDYQPSTDLPVVYFYDGCHYIVYRHAKKYQHRYIDQDITLDLKSVQIHQQTIQDVATVNRPASVYNLCQKLFGSKGLNRYHLVRQQRIHQRFRDVDHFQRFQQTIENNPAPLTDQIIFDLIGHT